MRKIISKIAGLMLGLSLAASVGVAVGTKKADHVHATGGTFVKITSDSNLTSGAKYLIVSEEDNLAFDGSLSTIDAISNTKAVSISNDSITASTDFYFTITSKSGGYSILGSGGQYIGSTGGNSNELKSGTSDSYTNTISWDSTNSCFVIRGTNSYLVYNSSSGQTRFRYYKPGTCSNGVGAGAYHKVSLFKEDSGEEQCVHNWVAGEVHAATCTEVGYTDYECSKCGETKQGDVVAALGHNYGEIIVDTAATCTEAGAGHKVCSRDSSHVENVVIPATGHNFVNGVCTACGAQEPSETTISLDFSSDSYGITSTQGDQTLTGDGATYGFEFGKGTGTGAKSNSGYILFGKTGVYFRNTSAPANSYISAIGWTYSGNVSTNVQLSLSYGSSALSAESSPITSFGKATTNGEVSLAQTDTSMSYFFIYVTNAYNCQWKSFTVTWSSKGGDTPGSTYSVTYNKNESSSRPVENMPTNVSGLEDGKTCTLTGSPIRWGYTFLGWGLSSDASSYVTSVTIDGADVNVYAIWGENHTVAGAWSDSPYTVAQAIAAITSGENVTDVYASGIINGYYVSGSGYSASPTSGTLSSGKCSFYISDDGSEGDDSSRIEAFSCKGLNNTSFTNVPTFGSTVTIKGSLSKFKSTNEFGSGCYLVEYAEPSTGDIEFTFNPDSVVSVGAEGTFSYACEVEGVTPNWVSSDSSILEVDSITGSYSAKTAGKASITLTLTKGSDTGTKTVEIEVAAVKTVTEANEIAAALGNKETTNVHYQICGFITNLDADGSTRAINITDGTSVIMVFFGGGSSDYTSVVSSSHIGTKLTVFGHLQNYNSTYEVKDIILSGIANGDAVSYSAAAYKSLDESCETGVDAVTETQWTALADGFNALPSAERVKLQADDVSVYGTEVVNWVNRYEIIVGNTSLTNFMSRSGILSQRTLSPVGEFGSSSMIIIVVVALTSISSIGVLLVIKRKRSLVK